MKILNLACSSHRPPPPFINVDILRNFLNIGSSERTTIDNERNYVDANLLNDLPFEDDSCEGVMILHFIEHLNVHLSLKLLKEALRVLVKDGILLVSVPDASYFRKVYDKDTPENILDLFGESGCYGYEKFFDLALFFHEHHQVLTEDSLWCLMKKSGCKNIYTNSEFATDNEASVLMKKEINRPKFSTVLWAVK